MDLAFIHRTAAGSRRLLGVVEKPGADRRTP